MFEEFLFIQKFNVNPIILITKPGMRNLLLLLIICSQFLNSSAQPPVTANGIVEKSGDTVTVTGRIYAGDFLVHVNTKPTFLKVFDSSPLHMLMLRIDSNDRKKFPIEPEKYYKDKMVSIRGVVSDYKGISLIKVVDPSMVSVDMNDHGPEPITSTGSYMSGEEFGFGKSDSVFRKTQDSVRKILEADPARKNKQVLQKYNHSDSVKLNTDKKEIVSTLPEHAIVENAKTEIPPEVVKTTVEEKKVTQPHETTPVAKAEEEKVAEVKKPVEPKEEEEVRKAEEPKKEEEPKVDTTVTIKPDKDAKEDAESDTITEEKPDKITQIKLRNIPAIKVAPKSVVTGNETDSVSAKTNWLKTISSQSFEPVVDELKEVKDGEIDMRTSPNMDAPVIAYLMKKMTIRITHRSKKWSYLTVLNPDGTTGLSGFIKNKAYKNLVAK